MDIDGKNAESQGDSEFKRKATEAFKTCVSGATMFGGVVWDLSKKAGSVARDKAKEMNERMKESRRRTQEEEENRRRMYEQQVRESTRCSEGNRSAETEASASHPVKTERRRRYRGDPKDKCFLMSYGWLFFVWWVLNFFYTGLCLWWYVSARDSPFTRDNAWVAIVVWLLALLFNRLAYEAAVAFFEMVRHLRQIRDELCLHNMREDEKWDAMRALESSDEAKAQTVMQDAPDGGGGKTAG